jgi:putative ABC transport system permease protein
VAVAVAAFVLVLASASAPLFLSAAADAAFARARLEVSGLVPGVRAGATGPADRDAYLGLDGVWDEEVRAIGGLSEPVRSLALVDDARGRPVETRLTGYDGEALAVLYWREGATQAVEAVGPVAPGDGVWVPEELAGELGLAAGDTATYFLERRVGSGTAGPPVRLEVPLRVAGVYRDPLAEGSRASADQEYWRRARPFLPTQRQSTAVAPLLLADRDAVLAAAAELGTLVAAGWESALVDPELPLAAARPLAAGLERVEEQAVDASAGLGRSAQAFTAYNSTLPVGALLPEAVARADATAAALIPPLQALSVAGQVVALGVAGAAAALLVRRRRSETRLLAVQGVSPVAVGLRAPVEVLPAVLAGAVTGWFASEALVRLTGPSALIAPDRRAQALSFAVVATLAALAVVAVSTGLAARGALEVTLASGRSPRRSRRVPWEAIALTLAGAAVYQVVLRSAARDAEGDADLLVALFPLLAVGGLVGVAARGLTRALPHLARLGAGRVPIPIWLAARRLGTGGPAALLLLTGAATALGVLLYALTLTASTGPAIQAKVAALSGSAATAEVFTPEAARGRLPDPETLPAGTTVVWRDEARVQPGSIAVSVLAVDARSFAAAASWHDRFADQALPALLDRLAVAAPELPVLVTGQTSSGASSPTVGLLEIADVAVPYQAIATPEAFPGMGERRAVLIVDARQLFPRLLDDPARAPAPQDEVVVAGGFRPEVWASGGEVALDSALEALGLGGAADLFEVRTADQVAARPELLAQTWTLNYLLALGVGGGVLAVAGLLLHLEQRRAARDVAYALTRRMGLSRVDSLRATVYELIGLLGCALLLAAVAALPAAWLVVTRLDPLPRLPPPPVAIVPGVALAGVAGAILLACAAGAAVLQWRADTADVAEVLRVAD